MITTKTFATTTKLLISAFLLSQVYSFTHQKFQSKTINYSAFNNLVENFNSISAVNSSSSVVREDTTVTNEIITVIDKEIKKKINRTRHAINTYKLRAGANDNLIAISNSETKIEKVAEKPIEKTAASKIYTSEDLSGFEINSKGLIELYALSVEQMAYTKFDSKNLAYSSNVDIKDEVDVSQASTGQVDMEADEVKIVQPSAERNEQIKPIVEETIIADEVKTPINEPSVSKEDQEMVMFDYSDKKETMDTEKTIDQKLYERPISNTVKAAIEREIGDTPPASVVKTNNQRKPAAVREDIKDIDLESEDNIIYDYSNDTVKRTESAARVAAEAVNAFTSPRSAETVDSQFRIRAKEINVSTHKIRQAHAFEFVPDYERTERTDDQTSGEISLGYSLSGETNIQTGIIQAQGMITTRVELNLGSQEGIEIPLINEEGIQQFLQKEGLAIQGNLILLALDSSITDTEIDSVFSQRFYFDKKFNIQTSGLSAAYVMYAGVKSGNILIRYLLNNKESAQKIIYVGDGEMYFEDAGFTESKRELYTFTTRNLLGQKKKELIIDGSAIGFFNTNIVAKKKALNAYEIKVPSLASGMRKYLEFKHLGDNIFVGTSGEHDIEIPSNGFIAKVLESNDVSSLKERCVVQINLSKDLREIKANGKNRSGEMFVETSFIDKDGNFSRDSELAEKAFVVGDLEGLFNVRMDYTDGSTEFLKTFCSEGTYLVEQL
ncbi:MAG: hypothetical protein WC635_07700 [Bacteriovorax sp.]|jgi:hypothetical protein